MEKDIIILKHKIDKCNNLIANLIFYELPVKKVIKATNKRAQYQVQLDLIQSKLTKKI